MIIENIFFASLGMVGIVGLILIYFLTKKEIQTLSEIKIEKTKPKKESNLKNYSSLSEAEMKLEEPTTELKIWEKGVKNEPGVVYLKLYKDKDKYYENISCVVVNEREDILAHLFSFRQRPYGTAISRYIDLEKKWGFALDEDGRIKIL